MRKLPSVADVGLAQFGIVPEIGQALSRATRSREGGQK